MFNQEPWDESTLHEESEELRNTIRALEHIRDEQTCLIKQLTEERDQLRKMLLD